MKIILFIAIGAAIGLVLNYLADILPEAQRLTKPICKKCGHSFTWKEYLFSFHCPECKAKPGLRYWLTLILSIAFSVLLDFFPVNHFN